VLLGPITAASAGCQHPATRRTLGEAYMPGWLLAMRSYALPAELPPLAVHVPGAYSCLCHGRCIQCLLLKLLLMFEA
jgi:hypothetical protein